MLQAQALPIDETHGQEGAAMNLLAQLPEGRYPNLAEVARDRSVHSESIPQADDEFEFGLTLILGALDPDRDTGR